MSAVTSVSITHGNNINIISTVDNRNKFLLLFPSSSTSPFCTLLLSYLSVESAFALTLGDVFFVVVVFLGVLVALLHHFQIIQPTPPPRQVFRIDW